MLDYELTSSLNGFFDINYSQRSTQSLAGFNYDYVLVHFPDTPYAPQSILDAAAGAPLLMNREHGDIGTRKLDTDRENVWLVLGIDGDLTENFGFELSYTYGESDVDDEFINNRYNDRFAAAMDAVVDPATNEVVCRSELDPAAEPFNLAFQGWNTYTAATWYLGRIVHTWRRRLCAHERVRRRLTVAGLQGLGAAGHGDQLELQAACGAGVFAWQYRGLVRIARWSHRPGTWR